MVLLFDFLVIILLKVKLVEILVVFVINKFFIILELVILFYFCI